MEPPTATQRMREIVEDPNPPPPTPEQEAELLRVRIEADRANMFPPVDLEPPEAIDDEDGA